MATSKLVLHVGLPKTASSALQIFLDSEREHLNRQSYDYPAAGLDAAPPKHQFLVGELLANRFPKLQTVVAASKFANIILSTEGLTNHLYDFKSDHLDSFNAITSGFEKTAFVVVREPEAWAKSYYKQAILNPRAPSVDYYATSLTLAEFKEHPRVKLLMRQGRLLEDVTQAYATSNIVVARFEDGWFDTFCKAFGLEFDGRRPVMANESPPDWSIELMRQVNACEFREIERTRWKSAIHAFVGTNHTILSRSSQNLHSNGGFESLLPTLANIEPRYGTDFPLSSDQIGQFRDFVGRSV